MSVMPKTIDAVYVERLFRIEDPAAWGGNLELRIDGIHRQQFPDLAAAGLTMAEQAAILGDRQGKLLALPCSHADLAEFIKAEGLLDRRTALWLALTAPRSVGNARLLSEAQVAEIRRRVADGEAKAALAREFGVHRRSIDRIVAGDKPAPRRAVRSTWHP